ncbi:MAG: carboxypeptidase-like regulatory domain-containing protein [Acidimicrobiia bacterium]|nr:carboxypeptidase-like regulatory domain-containing protein [Acidimicrobiia bacterium]
MTHARRRSTRSLALVAALALLFALLPGSAQAETATTVTPVPPGPGPYPPAGDASVSGTVTDPAGDPVDGVQVTRPAPTAAPPYVADGTYTVEGLVEGYYTVGFLTPDGSSLASEVDDDGSSSGTPVMVVADSETSGIDAQLAEGGTLSGVVSEEADGPVEARRSAWCPGPTAAPPHHGRPRPPPTAATTYRASARLDRVQVTPPPESDLVREYFDDAYTSTTADPVLVGLGDAVGGIDVALAAGGAMSGTLSLPGGAPAEGSTVYARSGPGQAYIGTIGPDGTWSIGGMVPGSYTVEFRPPFGSLVAPEYYDDAAGPGGATPVEVPAGDAATGIDAQLDPASLACGSRHGDRRPHRWRRSAWTCWVPTVRRWPARPGPAGDYASAGLPATT